MLSYVFCSLLSILEIMFNLNDKIPVKIKDKTIVDEIKILKIKIKFIFFFQSFIL